MKSLFKMGSKRAPTEAKGGKGSSSGRRLSAVSTKEMDDLNKALEGLFDKYKEKNGMTALGLVTFSKECSLIDAKLTEAEVSLAFQRSSLAAPKL